MKWHVGEKISVDLYKNTILVLEFKDQKGTFNKLDQATIHELKMAVDQISQESKKQTFRGLIIKSFFDSFILGADITEFKEHFKRPVAEFKQWLLSMHATFNAIEDLPYPSVSLLKGFALGGGFECALSTTYRVGTSSAMVGLPETKVGIFPGWGGTIRLSRLIGMDNAIEWIASGQHYHAAAALQVGAIDAVLEAGMTDEATFLACVEMIEQAHKEHWAWSDRNQQKQQASKLSDIDFQMIFGTAKSYILGQTGGNFPSPLEALEVMEKGARLKRAEAQALEVDGFVRAAQTSVAKALVNIFLGSQYLKKQAKELPQAKSTKTIAVLGAGIMGGGIAYQSVTNGVKTILKDIQPEALQKGMQETISLLNKQVERHKISPLQMAQQLLNVTPTTSSHQDIELADIVIEAVVEKIEIKQKVLAEIEMLVKSDTVLTSNTSSILISDLAEKLQRPEMFCGMHFFNPVPKMPLVEVIQGKKSSSEAIGRVVHLAIKMGKTPIIVKDCAGFFVNRILFPYFKGFLDLLKDGESFLFIDYVMQKFGWPMGPAYLLDVIGIDTAVHAYSVMQKHYPDRMTMQGGSAMHTLFEEKNFGQKSGKGFYEYAKNKKGILEKKHTPSVKQGKFAVEQILQRVMMPMIFEAARCLEEGIIRSPIEADMGVVMGLGFPAFRGGIFSYIDSIGTTKLLQQAALYEHLGTLYHAPNIIIAAEKKQQLFLP